MSTALITTENKGNYTSVELSILEAKYNSPIILKASKYDIDRSCVNIISKAVLDSGIQMKGTYEEQQASILQLSKSVAEDLRKYFKNITIKEFEIAVENGIRKEYGEYYGINVATIHQFVKAYKQSFDREEALRKQKLSHQEEEPKPTQEQINQIMDTACIKAFYQYKQTGVLADFGGSKFLHLEKIGIINLTLERKKQLFEQAKQEQIAQCNADIYKNTSESTAATIAKQIIKSPDKSEVVKNHARFIALKEFFDYLVVIDQELDEMIIEANR